MKKFFYILLLTLTIVSCGTGHVGCDAYGANDADLEELDLS
jgi:hypothetical protein